MTFYQNARDEVGINRETVSAIQNGIYIPNLEAIDNSPRFALDTFNTGTVTQKGSIANAKIFNGIKQLGISERHQETDLLAERAFHNSSPEILGAQLALSSGVKMTPKEQKTYGQAMVKIRNVVAKRNPTLASNMAYYTMGDGRNQFVPLMSNEKFTTQAVKDMETQNTSAWLANTLNIKQTQVPTIEKIVKSPLNTTTNNNTKISTEQLSSNQNIIPKVQKSRPLDLLEMQKRAYE
jgi:hypothetical protein